MRAILWCAARYARPVAHQLQSSLAGARARACALCLAALLALACAPVPAALAAGTFGGNSTLNKLAEEETPESTETTKAAATNTSSSSNSGISGSILAFAVGGAVVLLGGIVFVIMRDVRNVAPVTEAEFAEAGASRHSEAAMRKRRAKAKAARQQRKRNR